MKNTTDQRVKLDWSRLFGFNQVQSAQSEHGTKHARATLAAKIGGKPGLKPA
jgi:hypothetical protein